MSGNVSYIVCAWLGPRRSSYYTNLLQKDPYFLIRQHIVNLTMLSNPLIEKILVVINRNDDVIDSQLPDVLSKINCPIPLEVVYRDNVGFSYAAWEQGMQYLLDKGTDSDYFFLIEDDYVPAMDAFYTSFIHKMNTDPACGAVFQLYHPLNSGYAHAAISNGLLKVSTVRDCIAINGKPFNITYDNTYHCAVNNQMYFLDYVKSISNILDVSDTTHVPFYELRIESLLDYGDPTKPAPIVPVVGNKLLSFRKMTIDDLKFVNETRNEYCDEFLHTSTKFTLKETKSWFKKHKPDYYTITYANKNIGYFRLSNYSTENKNIYIGADINSKYTGLKLAYYSYIMFIDYLFAERDLNKITLEVLETNKRAINLYIKLGFTYEGQKRQEVYKNGVYVDSIIMSILKEEWNNRKNS